MLKFGSNIKLSTDNASFSAVFRISPQGPKRTGTDVLEQYFSNRKLQSKILNRSNSEVFFSALSEG